MGLRNAISYPSTKETWRKNESAQSPEIGSLSPSDQPLERQCGRCRQFFAVDTSASPRGKWWVCADCHDKLFDTMVGLYDNGLLDQPD